MMHGAHKVRNEATFLDCETIKPLQADAALIPYVFCVQVQTRSHSGGTLPTAWWVLMFKVALSSSL